MNQPRNPIEWEHYFTEESLMVEELLSSGDFLFLSQSRIRIALENKILSWDKYKLWIQSQNEYVALKSDLDQTQIEHLKNKYLENKKIFDHYSIWSEDLIPIELWDDQIIIIGLLPTEKLLTLPNAVFILCPPVVLNQIIEVHEIKTIDTEKDFSDHLELNVDAIELLDLDQNISKPMDLSFSSLQNKNTQTAFRIDTTETHFSIWNLIESNHLMDTDLARKQFDAYVVLKIVENQTEVFKMDEDLIKENLDPEVFKFKLNEQNPFAKAYKNGLTDSFSLDEQGLVILDFKYACMTPLKLGSRILGFLVGFKMSELSNQDTQVLESISVKNVA